MAVTSDDTTVTITLPGTQEAKVQILKFGATVLSWKINGFERLFLSDSSKLDGTRAVRGGIPIVFPRFGPPKGDHPATDKLPQHGFARSSHWEFLGETSPTSVQFGLGPENLDDKTKAAWPFDFSLIATVSLATPTELGLKIEVENTDSQPFDFNVLLHTYFRVPEVEKINIDGFEQLKFYNKVLDSNDESGKEPITIHSEFDRIYKSTPNKAVINSDGSPLFTVESSPELTDTVVWNPWTSVEQLTDFSPKEGFHRMICVENGNVAKFTSLAPGKKWSASVTLKSHI